MCRFAAKTCPIRSVRAVWSSRSGHESGVRLRYPYTSARSYETPSGPTETWAALARAVHEKVEPLGRLDPGESSNGVCANLGLFTRGACKVCTKPPPVLQSGRGLASLEQTTRTKERRQPTGKRRNRAPHPRGPGGPFQKSKMQGWFR